METIQYFLTKLLKTMGLILAVVLFFIILGKFFPNFSDRFNFFSSSGSFFTDDWLPAPVNMTEAAKGTKADLTQNQYEGMMTPGTSYVVYTDTGMKIVNVPPKTPFNPYGTGYTDTSLFVRNVSVRHGESITTGKIITGEVKTSFFYDGRFPVYLIDNTGKAYAIETAISNGQGTFPGWTQFRFQIRGLLPQRMPCQLLFVPDPSSPDGSTRNRAALSVQCN